MKAVLVFLSLIACIASSAQSVTFAVDEVELPEKTVGWQRNGHQIATSLNRSDGSVNSSEWNPQIPASSFAGDILYDIGEDVLFQMLLKAWCQHRPVTLTPDAVWMVIAQGFSFYVNEHPEDIRGNIVDHEGKKVLKVEANNLFSDQADWEGLIGGFTAGIEKYTGKGIASTLVADFSTTGVNERIASEVVLMDAVKPYFHYEMFYCVCGIPSVTLTGTPEDWRKVLEKTRALDAYGLGWWVEDLEPILKEFINAAEGNPDIPFWKDMVKKTRPQTVQGPVCSRKKPKLTKFDGWFLKLFPFDNNGRTPWEITITQTMLPETVCVPFRYDILDPERNVIVSYDMELVAGIVGVKEDPLTFMMTPAIGWFVRTAKSPECCTCNQAITSMGAGNGQR